MKYSSEIVDIPMPNLQLSPFAPNGSQVLYVNETDPSRLLEDHSSVGELVMLFVETGEFDPQS